MMARLDGRARPHGNDPAQLKPLAEAMAAVLALFLMALIGLALTGKAVGLLHASGRAVATQYPSVMADLDPNRVQRAGRATPTTPPAFAVRERPAHALPPTVAAIGMTR